MEFVQTEFDFQEEKMDKEKEQTILDIANNVKKDIVTVEPEMIDDSELEEVDDECLSLETVDDADISNLEIRGGEWVNKNLVPIEKVNVYIPLSLFKAIKNIESCVNKKFTTKNEFSIYIHGEYDEEGDLIVSEDYYIPKQKVGVASVDYQEPPEPYFNGCLHKHPDGCMNFSGVDKKYINSNFEFSLLYVRHEIHLGIVNIQYHKNRRIQVPVNVCVEEEYTDEIDIENIYKEEPKPVIQQRPVGVATPRVLLPGFESSNNEIVLPSVANPACQQDDGCEIDVETDFDEMFPQWRI